MKELDWPLRAFCEQRRQRWLDAAYGPHAGYYRCRAETEARMKPEVGGSDRRARSLYLNPLILLVPTIRFERMTY